MVDPNSEYTLILKDNRGQKELVTFRAPAVHAPSMQLALAIGSIAMGVSITTSAHSERCKE